MDKEFKYAESDPTLEALLATCTTQNINRAQEALKNLKNKEDLNRKGKGGYNALQIARAKNNKPMIEFLINAGANPNEKDCLGFTPLQLACWRRQNDIAKILIEHGADPYIVDPLGLTTIELAEQIHNDELLEILQKKR